MSICQMIQSTKQTIDPEIDSVEKCDTGLFENEHCKLQGIALNSTGVIFLIFLYAYLYFHTLHHWP